MTNVTAQAVVNTASTWVGYNGGPNYSTPFGTWYGLPNQLWCAMFVSYCEAKAADATGTSNPIAGIESAKGFAWTPAGVAWFKTKGTWHNGTSGVQPGDLVFWSYGANGPGLASHVGIAVSASDGTGFWTIQGDTTDTESGNGNCCRRKYVYHSNGYLLGYGRPAYGQATASSPASGTKYTVKADDTLSGIAAANHTTVPELVKLNAIANPNRINVGQVLILSAVKSTGGNSVPVPTKPAQPKAPAYPLPAGYWYGPPSGPAKCISGKYPQLYQPGWVAGLKQWQQRMYDRGWHTINVTGVWDEATGKVAKAFKAEKHVGRDRSGNIGRAVWAAAWEVAVTP